jgi:hypothetical protein
MLPVLDKSMPVKLVWSDEFDGDLSSWHQDDFLGVTPHRTGSKYLTDAGMYDAAQGWTSAPVRHAGRYDKFRDVVHRIENNQLVLQAVVVKEKNELRQNFTDKGGVVHRYGEHKIYLPWLSTSLYMGKPDGGGLISDPSTLLGTAKPGTVSEVRVNLTKQMIRNMRWNFWLMSTVGKDYDKNVAEVEIDTPEAQYSVRTDKFGNSVLMKVVGGEAGDTPNGQIDLASFGINLREGWHTFTLVWNLDGTLEFNIDGILVNRDDRHITMNAYFIMAFECNSGVKEARPVGDQVDWENYETDVYMPEDTGLTAESCILDIDLISQHEVRVDYVRVWEIVKAKTSALPDIDLGVEKELTIDQEIQMLADLYEKAETEIIALNRSCGAYRDVIESLNLRNSELDREKTELIAKVDRFVAVEHKLLTRIDALVDEKATLKDVSEQGPPVTPESRQRLRELLSRATSTDA